jgi:hypothetical protein
MDDFVKLNINGPSASAVENRKVGLVARIFGCWHSKMSRPMTIDEETYCVCANCGARIRFDPKELKTVGHYYYPPMSDLYPED